MANVVVVGSLNMDVVVSLARTPRTGETIRGDHLQYVPGGKGANQAVGCARLGLSTMMVGCVGDDGFGQELRRSLQDYGVDTAAVRTISGTSSGTALITHTPDDNSIIIIGGANDHCLQETVEDERARIASADVLVVQLEVPQEAVLAALQIAREHGVITILNPAPAAELPDAIKLLADYVTPNETEWELISGHSGDDDAQLYRSMQQWTQLYGGQVLVTRGEKGCSYMEADRLATVAPPKVEVQDTTGAGDAFNAAFAYGLVRNRQAGMAKLVSFAVACASLSVQRFGAQAGMPTLEEAQAYGAN